MRYKKSKNGKLINVYDLEECLQSIRIQNEDKDDRIKYLQEENKKLKDEAYKDNELQDMKNKLDKMQEDYYRGFPITEKEESAIKAWTKKHDEEVHKIMTQEDRIMAGGCIGGRYSYHFVPTSIGTIGTVKCSCGAEFTFCELN
jgi:hypothetical protein